jgi:hypothetical protein
VAPEEVRWSLPSAVPIEVLGHAVESWLWKHPYLYGRSRRAVGYHRRNPSYMLYEECLACGWPVGTGVVEAACGDLVKDRMEHAATHWTQVGAQGVPDLLAIRLNSHWALWRSRRRVKREGRSAPCIPISEHLAAAKEPALVHTDSGQSATFYSHLHLKSSF